MDNSSGNWLITIFITVAGLITTLIGALWRTHDKRLTHLDDQVKDLRSEFTEALDNAVKAAEVHSTLKMESVRESIEGIRMLMTTMHESNIRLIGNIQEDVRDLLQKELTKLRKE